MINLVLMKKTTYLRGGGDLEAIVAEICTKMASS